MEFKVYTVAENFYSVEFQILPNLESISFLENIKLNLLPVLEQIIIEMPIGLNSIGLVLKNNQYVSESFLINSIDNAVKLVVNYSIENLKRGNSFEIKVSYEGEDLEYVSQKTGMSVSEIITLHSSGVYKVGMIGFLPGFPYILGLPEQLKLPRKEVPKVTLKAGSVGIADIYTGIYPSQSPGGWHILGYTDFELFNINKTPFATLKVGDSIKFLAI
jgi:inhibitor of KinA